MAHIKKSAEKNNIFQQYTEENRRKKKYIYSHEKSEPMNKSSKLRSNISVENYHFRDVNCSIYCWMFL